jgi:heme-degrading monooxygenase HmoA
MAPSLFNGGRPDVAMKRILLAILGAPCCLLTACGGSYQAADPVARPIPSVARGHDESPLASSAPAVTTSAVVTELQPVTIDLRVNPQLQVRIDAFSVPAASRNEFEATMHQNAAFIAKLGGFKGHVVFEEASGPTAFNIVTFAAWESPEAMKSAGEKVREDYERTGFDMQRTIARWGVTASLGGYDAPKALQGSAVAGVDVQPLTIDLKVHPNQQFRIDAFSVPAASRAEFETTMHANFTFIEKLPGFVGHMVFEKTGGPTTFNIVTLAAFETAEAMKSAGQKVREHYQSIGFDMQGAIARWGVTASLGNYRAPLALQ